MIGSGDEFAMIFPAIVSRTVSYSPECVEVEFCELRLYGVLGSSRVLRLAQVASRVVGVAPMLHNLAAGDAEHVDGPHLHPLTRGCYPLESSQVGAAHCDEGRHTVPI